MTKSISLSLVARDCLPDRSAYIAPERAAIFGRFGPMPAPFTLVAVGTRFSTENAPTDPLSHPTGTVTR